MSPITAFRADLARILTEAGIPTTDHLPSVIGTAPRALLQFGTPYLEQTDDRTFAEIEFRARLDVRLLTDPTTDNADATHALDDLTFRALTALAGYEPLVVSEPELFVSQQTNYLSVRITATEYFTIERKQP